ncbi:hypothetical protein [Paenibacillus sp. QZ-Y1]|uniref:hypothetical protein n=1 Tax=Paenibacillus sp. QZ-Y1 TaxID=3414511 RepID=UPI003F7A8052
MMKQIEKVKLVFENCDSLDFKVDEIDRLDFSDIRKRKYMINDDKIIEINQCALFDIGIKSKANKPYYPFEQDGQVEPIMKFDRIKEERDLVAISVQYIDGTEDYIYVPWDDEKSDYVNYKQQVTSDEDYLYILIK